MIELSARISVAIDNDA